jgi:DNA mismatch repair protein MSH5
MRQLIAVGRDIPFGPEESTDNRLVIEQTKPTVLLTSARVDYLNTAQSSEQGGMLILDNACIYI